MKTLVETGLFKLTEKSGQFWIKRKARHETPAAVRVSRRDAERYLLTLNRTPSQAGISTFDMACLWDFGCAVFQK